tara:strand:- start:16 stop:807 length:792 start_codon:yes stop_codon:yes gene_type:complete
MRSNKVKDRITTGKTIVNAWLAIPSSYSAEGMGQAGFHSVTVDMQHGMLGFSDALHMLQAISATPATPLVRVPELNKASIMRLLDAGAYGIICPMISTADDARALVAACRYPPIGERSFGPARGLLYGGLDYVAKANDVIMAIPMIETLDGVENIDEILDVTGIDMIYIGPNDLAFSMEGSLEFPRSESEAAISFILERAQNKGCPTGIFCSDVGEAKRRVEQGFNLVTPGNDFNNLIQSSVSAVRGVLGAYTDSSGLSNDEY